MEQIRILFVRHDFSPLDISSYLSLIIRLVIGFRYNHCAIYYEEDGFRWVVESRSGGVMKVTWENWLKHRPNKEWIMGKEITVSQFDINSRLGNQYNIPSLFSQLFYRISGVWIGSKDDMQENCSEFVADLLHVDRAYLATPKSLYYLTK